jgi:hypothetical protein
MEHAVLGAGAIGGLVATAMAPESEQVTLLVRPHTHTDHPGMLRLQRPHDAMRSRPMWESQRGSRSPSIHYGSPLKPSPPDRPAL